MVKEVHYLPKFYLEKFSDNGKISALNISDGTIIHTNVEKIDKKTLLWFRTARINVKSTVKYHENFI